MSLLLALLPLVVMVTAGAMLCRFWSAQVRLLVHTRFPLLMGVFGCFIGPLCWLAPGLLGNLLYLDDVDAWLAGQMFHLTWLSMLFATVCLAMARVTLRHAADRFPGVFVEQRANDEGIRNWIDEKLGTWRWGWASWFSMLLLALPTPLCCLWYTVENAEPGRSVARLIGEMFAGAIAYAVCRKALTTIFVWREIAAKTPNAPDSDRWYRKLNRRVALLIEQTLGPGYVYPTPANGLSIAAGHRWLTLLTIVLLAVYVQVGLMTGDALSAEAWEQSQFPTLFFGLLAALLLGSVLSAAAFYLDRYRVPVLLVSTALGFVAYALGGADHEYVLRPEGAGIAKQGESELPTSGAVIANWIRPEQTSLSAAESGDAPRGAKWLWREPGSPANQTATPTVVVVTAAGGGIQASAWTARVLTGLHERYGNTYANSIGLISAVSGGSVGTHYYLLARREYAQALTGQEPEAENVMPSRKAIDAVNRAARHSGLEAVGWGVLYPDLTRLALPSLYPTTTDRGWALEASWRGVTRELTQTLGLPDSSPPRLSDLGIATRYGLPIVAFNATIAESGQRFVMGSVKLSREPGRRSGYGAEYLWQLYPGNDLRLSTAVRLSSTFPIVTPMARPIQQGDPAAEGQRYYICDGGYSDNEGFVTALDWIENLVRTARQSGVRSLRVLVIRIIPFPVTVQPKASAAGFASSWSYATAGPLLAMMAVRKSSQPERNEQLAELLEGRASFEGNIEFEQVRFVFRPPTDEAIVPLNWKLTPRQMRGIDRAWDSLVQEGDIGFVDESHPLFRMDQLFEPRTGRP